MKVVGQCMYVHRSNVAEVLHRAYPKDAREIERILRSVPPYSYDVVKYDSAKHRLSLIESPDWDTAYEPLVGDSRVYNLMGWSGDPEDCVLKRGRSSNPQIYHMKEVFVAPGYRGFDVGKAAERTRLLARLSDIDPKRKGNLVYWEQKLREHGIPVDDRRGYL